MEILSVVLLSIVALVSYLWFTGRKNMPNHLKEIPGPRALPLIGNIHQMSKVQTDQFCKWSEEFWDIYQLNLAGQKVIIVSNAEMSKELLNMAALTGRPSFKALGLYENQEIPQGILNSEWELWSVHRRFLLRQLREFGFGKSSMEQRIVEELDELLKTLKGKESKEVGQLDMLFRLPVINSLWVILTSKRIKQDDPELLKIATEATRSVNEAVSGSGLVVVLPFIAKLMPELSGYRRVRNALDPLLKFFTQPVLAHKQSFEAGQFRDFIDVYLAEVKKKTEPSSPFYGELAERQLVNTLFDVFFAGSDTTINTLTWTMLYMCGHKDKQTKLQKEIDAKTNGNSRRVVLADRKSMPYAQATIDEVLRHSSVIGDGAAHLVTSDTEFQSYFLPKGASMQPNLYFIHHDPKVWGDPHVFRPERFLQDGLDGEMKYVKNENIQPFQTGKRICVGETLARDTLFLFITNTFQMFDIEFAQGQENFSEFESVPGFFRGPKPFRVVMKQRI